MVITEWFAKKVISQLGENRIRFQNKSKFINLSQAYDKIMD